VIEKEKGKKKKIGLGGGQRCGVKQSELMKKRQTLGGGEEILENMRRMAIGKTSGGETRRRMVKETKPRGSGGWRGNHLALVGRSWQKAFTLVAIDANGGGKIGVSSRGREGCLGRLRERQVVLYRSRFSGVTREKAADRRLADR